MNTTRQCRQCNVPFEFRRADHFFCSGKCVAQYYRDRPSPEDIHADLPKSIPQVCNFCGIPYGINDYADRGGKRTPKYCSNRCRQAAFRRRNNTSTGQSYRSNSTGENQQRRPPPPPPPPNPPHPPHPRYTNRWDEALAILRLTPGFTKSDLQRAYRARMFEVHPDLNHAPDAVRQAQAVNWAYEYLKR